MAGTSYPVETSGGDGATLDGVSSSIKATVLDFVSSNPLAVHSVDTNGDYSPPGAGTQYTEDAAAAANPVGNVLILVREDARAGSLTTTDGDNVAARGNDKGEQYVKATDTDAILGATNGAAVVTDADGTIQRYLRGIVKLLITSGTIILGAGTAAIGKLAANSGVTIGAVEIAATQTLSTVTTVGAVTAITNALPAGTNAIGKLAANSGVDIGDVDVTTVGTITPGTAATALGKAEDAAHSSGDVGVMALAVSNEANTQFAADADYVPLGTNREGSLRILGTRAHDAVDADGPVKVGQVAIAHGTNPTAVAAADRTNWYANRAGVPFVIGGHPNPVTIEAAYTAAQTDTAIVTVSSGLKIVVTRIKVVADNANTVDVGYRVGFAATNTPTTAGVVSSHPGLAAGSGVTEGNGGGILGVGADGEDLRITSEVPTTGSMRVVVTYFTVES